MAIARTQNIGTRRTRGRAASKAPASVEAYLDEAAQALATLDGDELAAGFNEAAANIADYANAGIVTANRWLHERMTKYRARALGRHVNPVAYSDDLTDAEKIALFESEYRKLPAAYRRNLLAILNRETEAGRRLGLDVLALKAFPSSPTQKLLISLRGSASNPAFDAVDQLRALAAEITELALMPKTPGRHRRLRQLQADYRKAERALAKSEGAEPRRRTHKVSRGYREINGKGKVFFQGELYYLRDGQWYLKNAPDDMADLHIKITDRGLNILLWNAYHKKQREHNPSPWDTVNQLQKTVSDLGEQIDRAWDNLPSAQRDKALADLEPKHKAALTRLRQATDAALYQDTTGKAKKQNGPLLDAFNFVAGADEMSQAELVEGMRELESRGFTVAMQPQPPRKSAGNYAAKYGDGYLVVYVPEQVKGSRRANPGGGFGRPARRVSADTFGRMMAGALARIHYNGVEREYIKSLGWTDAEIKRAIRSGHVVERAGILYPVEQNPLAPATAAFLSGYAVDYLGKQATRKPRKRSRRANPAELIEPYVVYKDDAGFFGVVDRRNGKPLRALDGAPYAFQYYAWAVTVANNANREWLDNQPAKRKRSRNARVTRNARIKRTNARRMNPETSIADISLLFQGEINGQELMLEAPDGTPGELARIGKLDSLELKEDGARVEFENAFVGCDADGDLHIVGFDLAMPDYAAPAGHVNDMGEIEVINYTTAKKHITGGKVTSFYHNFGEDTGVKPHLVIDHEGMPIISGGAYKIKTEGIVN